MFARSGTGLMTALLQPKGDQPAKERKHAMPSPPGNGRQPEPAPDDDETLCSPAEVAQMLGGGKVTDRTVVRRWRAWGLTAYRIGRELRFKRSDVRAMIAARKVPPHPAGTGTGTGTGTADTPTEHAAPRRRT